MSEKWEQQFNLKFGIKESSNLFDGDKILYHDIEPEKAKDFIRQLIQAEREDHELAEAMRVQRWIHEEKQRCVGIVARNCQNYVKSIEEIKEG